MGSLKLYSKKISITEIIETNKEILSERPILICNLSEIINKLELWSEYLPKIKPFYPVKCNNELNVLKIFQYFQCGFDCASKSEMSKILSLGATADEIVYANPCKSKDHLIFARKNNIHTMTFDNSEELFKIKKYYPNAKLLLRFRSDATESNFVLGEKYGCDPDTEGPELLKLCKKLNLNVVGLAFHVGSGCREFNVYERSIKIASILFEIGKEIGLLNMKILDIGGGFPGNSVEKFKKIANIVNKSLKLYFPNNDVNNNELQVIAEPGSYFVLTSQMLITDIISKREFKDKKGNVNKIFYYINDGVFGSLSVALWAHENFTLEFYENNNYGIVEKFDEENCITKYKSIIWGPTLDSTDKIETREMPNLKMDSKIVFYNVGSYAQTLASGFNEFSLPLLQFYLDKEHDKAFKLNLFKC